MALAAILHLLFLSILVKLSISGGSRLHYCKISFIYVNRRLFVQKSKMAAAAILNHSVFQLTQRMLLHYLGNSDLAK